MHALLKSVLHRDLDSLLAGMLLQSVQYYVNNINTKKNSEVLSLLRPNVHDTSKTAKITWFILVLHWTVDVIEVLYYIRGPVEY